MFVCGAGKQGTLAVEQEEFKCRVMDKGAGLVTYVCKQLRVEWQRLAPAESKKS